MDRSSQYGSFPSETMDNHKESLQQRLSEKLESKASHLFILFLVFLDLCIVLVEISITLLEQEELEELVIIDILSYISLAILTIFILENVLKLVVFGPLYYIKGKHGWLHALDAIIVATSFILELTLKGRQREIASLLILFRFWRILRVIDAVAISVDLNNERNIRQLEEQCALLEERLKDQEEENMILRKELQMERRRRQ
ncbi:Protein arginine N-methyltransferase 3 [Basidiobolus ranarum]|uniref:Voltage-gated hydrogen channel 1 n=1 Tax=Basidiobolus ranarum TaxID=34480 RepID=A0ABR2WZ23_9FUNG